MITVHWRDKADMTSIFPFISLYSLFPIFVFYFFFFSIVKHKITCVQ